jgi:hypothetical protein
MSNLRIIYDNAADRAALTASSWVGTLGAANLQRESKNAVLRSANTSQQVTAIWPIAETLACVVLTPTNFTSGAYIRVRVWGTPGDGMPVFDSGYTLACAPAPLGSFPLGVLPLGHNAYQWGGVNTWARGGGAAAVLWFPRVRGRQMLIDIIDTQNPQGYVEAGRLIAGDYWDPAYNADYGAAVQVQDSSERYRTGAGNLKTRRGTMNDKMTLQLSHMSAADRARFMRILRENGAARPLLVSLFPEHADPLLEQDHLVYGLPTNLGAVGTPYYNTYATPLEIEGI